MKSFAETHEGHDQIAGRYPRLMTLSDRTEITVTPMVASDWRLLERLLEDTPEEERRFFRREVSDSARVERWCSQLDYAHVLPLLAWRADRIAADAVLEREPGLWTSHVGKVRILVHPDSRRLGLGALLLRELAVVAREFGLHKLTYECVAEQTNLIAFLTSSGFTEVARLSEFIRDRKGDLHDMVLMVLDLSS